MKKPIVTKTLSGIIALGLLGSAGTAFGATQNSDGSITVESGDTLSQIAEVFGGDYHEYKGYKSGDPNLIYPGEKVTRKVTETNQTVSDDKLKDLAERTYAGEFGNDPDRHAALAAIVGEDGANAVQEIVNGMVAAGTATVTDAARGYVTETTTKTVTETKPAKTMGAFANTVAPTDIHRAVTNNGVVTKPVPGYSNTNTPKRVWVSDNNGHYELVWVNEPVYETQKVLVKDAWEETINHPEETITVTVTDKDAWTEQVLVKDAWTETVHHPAVTETVIVVDAPARTETKVVKDAWTETVNHPAEEKVVTPGHYETVIIKDKEWVPPVTKEEPVYETQNVEMYRFPDGYERPSSQGGVTWEEMDAHGDDYTVYYKTTQVQTGTTTVIVTPGYWTDPVTEQKWVDPVTETIPAWTETIDHPAITEEVTIPAVTHEETNVIREAWDEEVTHPAEYKDVYHPAITHEEERTVPEWTETITHPAEYTDKKVQTGTKRVQKQGKWIPSTGRWVTV